MSNYHNYIVNSFKYTIKYRLKYSNIKLIGLLLGFFIATVLSTMPAQTGDSSIIAASFITTCNEILSRIVYSNKKRCIISPYINYIKIGVVYGLFVDAFKLGS